MTSSRLRNSTRRLAVRWNRARALSSNPLCYKLMKLRGDIGARQKAIFRPLRLSLARSLTPPSPHRAANKRNAPDKANHTTNNTEAIQNK